MKDIVSFEVTINKIEAINSFVSLAQRCCFPVDVSQKQYKVNGRSVLGLYSLDLSKTVTIEGDVSDKYILEEIRKLGESD